MVVEIQDDRADRRRFPHMYRAEREIWREFLKDHEDKWGHFVYDVHVGKLWPELALLPQPWRRGAEAVYLKRIDVVGYRPGEIVIFEVKPHAGLGALGQIIGYMDLYEEGFAPAEEIFGAIVTRLVDPNLERLFVDRGISLYVYPEA